MARSPPTAEPARPSLPPAPPTPARPRTPPAGGVREWLVALALFYLGSDMLWGALGVLGVASFGTLGTFAAFSGYMFNSTIVLTGGPMLEGCLGGRDLSLISVFEAVGQVAAGKGNVIV